MKLSVVIPVYNERLTILEILKRIEQVDIPQIDKEIIIVDDCSTDGTRDILGTVGNQYRIHYHKKNLGKGAAIRSALKLVSGDIILIQDADLEYDPQDYHKLLKPIISGKTGIVYGSRALYKRNRSSSRLYFWGGRLVCTMTNLLYGSKLSDVNCCYKVFKREIINSIELEGNRFEFCEEVTAKVLKQKYKIIEVPARYYPRTFKEGKKINWKDGITALKILFKYRFFHK